MENILEPGLKIVYNGIKQSTQTKLTLYYPNIKPGQYYKFLIQSKNCGLFSAGESLTLASGSAPQSPPTAPYVLTYDSATEMTVKWDAPLYDGGFPITSYKLYVDNSEEVELDPSLNWYQLSALTLG